MQNKDVLACPHKLFLNVSYPVTRSVVSRIDLNECENGKRQDLLNQEKPGKFVY